MKINENRKSLKTAALIFIDCQYQSINSYWFLLTVIDVIDYWFWLNDIVRKNWENWFELLEGKKNWGLNYSVWQVREVSFGSNYREFWKTKGSENRDSKNYWQFRGLTKYHLPWTICQTSLICGRVVKDGPECAHYRVVVKIVLKNVCRFLSLGTREFSRVQKCL